MRVKLDPDFISKLKKQNIRIRKSFKEAIDKFLEDHNDAILNNHALKREWEGYRSIDITADYRAIFQEIEGIDEIYAYFVTLGSHKQLYQKSKN